MSKMIEFMPPINPIKYFTKPILEQNLFKNIALTFRGRDAISLGTQFFKINRDDIVLLPGYLCDTILAAFDGTCKFLYYDINFDFTINIDSIFSIISKYDVKVLYVIHYFGFLYNNISQLRKICRENKILLWEDHAHSTFSRFKFEYADAMIFSFRKLLPIPDGGGLWIRDVPVKTMVEKYNLTSDIVSFFIIIKRNLWNLSNRLRTLADEIAKRNVENKKKGLKNTSIKPISRFSRRIVCSASIEYNFNLRRMLFLQWLLFFKKSAFSPVFSELTENAGPQGFPIWTSNADVLIKKLEPHNVFIKIHWPLPYEVKKTCPTAWRISKSIVTLPIYPGLKKSDMQKIITLLDKYGKPLGN